MTKAVTGAAAMQLVEAGRLDLDAPSREVRPWLGRVQVLEGYDARGTPHLRPPDFFLEAPPTGPSIGVFRPIGSGKPVFYFGKR